MAWRAWPRCICAMVLTPIRFSPVRSSKYGQNCAFGCLPEPWKSLRKRAYGLQARRIYITDVIHSSWKIGTHGVIKVGSRASLPECAASISMNTDDSSSVKRLSRYEDVHVSCSSPTTTRTWPV